MLHTITKRLEICIEIKIEISEVDHYRWIFTSRIFRLALEITFLLNKYIFLQMTYQLVSQSRKLNKQGGRNKSDGGGRAGNFFEKKIIGGGPEIRDPKVLSEFVPKNNFRHYHNSLDLKN